MGLLTARPSSTHFVADHPLFLDIKETSDWKSQFGNSNPLKLEIGFGNNVSNCEIDKSFVSENPFVHNSINIDRLKFIDENIYENKEVF